MSDEFELLRDALVNKTAQSSDPSLHNLACNRRIVSALSHPNICRPGEADLAVLTRHAIRREQEKQGGVSPTIAVPRDAPWPSRVAWETYGIDVVNETQSHHHIR